MTEMRAIFFRSIQLLAGALFFLLPATNWCSPALQHANAMTRRFQALLDCKPGAHQPSPQERIALRKAGGSVIGFAGDGRVVIDDRHDDGGIGDLPGMLLRFPQPLMHDGFPVSTLYLQSVPGDMEDLTVYAQVRGNLRAFVNAHRLKPAPRLLPLEIDISGGIGDVSGIDDFEFTLTYFKWARPLSKTQILRLRGNENNFLPGAHRFPNLFFAAPVKGAPEKFVFGCKTFGPDPSPIEGL